jgi:hypothetical protein
MHNMEKCGREKDGLKGARYVRIAAGDLRPCPRPFPQPLRSAMSSMHRCCTSELKRRWNSRRTGFSSAARAFIHDTISVKPSPVSRRFS